MQSKIVLASFVALAGCSSGSGQAIDPYTWTCESLVEPIMEMSRERSLQILELTDVRQQLNSPNYRIECIGSAEWNVGSGAAVFGAHVSEGGSVIIEYRQL